MSIEKSQQNNAPKTMCWILHRRYSEMGKPKLVFAWIANYATTCFFPSFPKLIRLYLRRPWRGQANVENNSKLWCRYKWNWTPFTTALWLSKRKSGVSTVFAQAQGPAITSTWLLIWQKIDRHLSWPHIHLQLFIVAVVYGYSRTIFNAHQHFRHAFVGQFQLIMLLVSATEFST